MSGALLGFLALLLIVGAGALVAATIGVDGVGEVLLVAYVVAFAEIVGLSLLLSVSDGLTRGYMLGGAMALLVIGAAVCTLHRRRVAVNLRPARVLIESRHCLVLGVVVAVAFAYVFALLIGTPPNGWDPLNYHLSRVAFWLQSNRIGYVEPTYDERVNLNPPDAEIGSAFALGITHDEVFTGIVQLAAALACAVAVFGIARRIGSGVREAAFGALLFSTLPIVLLQASLSKNDLVVASLLLAAVFFLLGERHTDVVFSAVATALAVGTKTTALYGLVVLVIVAAVAQPVTRRAIRLAAIGAGALTGSYWYVINLVETGHFFGDQSAQQNVTATLHLGSNVVTAVGTAVDLLDLSGARGRDILIYLVVAVVVAAISFSSTRSWRSALSVALWGLVPLVLLAVTDHLGRPALVHLSNAVGDSRGYLATGAAAASPTIASDTASWFGPIGFICVVAVTGFAMFSQRRRAALPRPAVVFAFAPLMWFALVALTLSYNPFLGRFFIFPVALSAVLWGRVLRWPTAASGLVVLAVVTAGLALVHYAEKPAGVRLLDRSRQPSVWNMARWDVQSQHDPALSPVLQFFDEQVGTHASVALALSDNGFGYPMFGPHLTRHVALVSSGSNAREVTAQWLYASRDRVAQIDTSCWQPQLQSSEGSVYRRLPDCPS